MPEQNFEQQARDMANGFEMKPRNAVWQNVRNAIHEPQGKRRIALWWWLLPLGLLGGIALYTVTKTNTVTQITGKPSVHQTTANSTNNLSAQEQTKTEKDINKKDTNAIVHHSIKDPLNQQQSTVIVTHNSAVNKKKKNHPAFDGYAKYGNESNKISDVNSDKLNSNNTTSSISLDNEYKRIVDGLMAEQNHPPVQLMDSIHTMPLLNDTLLPASATTATVSTLNKSDSVISSQSNLSVINKEDSSRMVKASVINQNDSVNINHSTSTVNKKLKPKLQWGLLAEAGFAERRSPVFSLAGTDKSNDVPVSSPNSNSSGSAGGSTGRNGFRFNNTIKKGAAYGLGVTLQKPLNKNIDFFTDISYQYQSFKLTTIAYRDSLVLNNYLTSLAGSYEATQSFHFVSVFAGINWHFINTKHIQFGISAGADNLFLLSAKQKISNLNGSNPSYAAVVQASDSTFAINNFYKCQPGLFAGVLVNLQLGKQQLQLVPFTRSSFRPFEKNSTSNNNHLFAAGLRAVYFFK